MNKRRRTSSDLETDDSEESEEQFPTVPIVGRKRKKLDPVSCATPAINVLTPNTVYIFRWNYANSCMIL